MKIFNVIISGTDEQWFCSLSREEKIEWIINNTNQGNPFLIETFLDSKKKGADCGCGCGGEKEVTKKIMVSKLKSPKRKK